MHGFGCGLQGERALRFIYLFIYCFWWGFFGLNLMKVLGNHLDTDASKLTFNVCMCKDAYQ